MDIVEKACEDFGVAYCEEVLGSASAIAMKSGMKPLERRRFIAACSTLGQEERSLPVDEPVAKRARVSRLDDSEVDDAEESSDEPF